MRYGGWLCQRIVEKRDNLAEGGIGATLFAGLRDEGRGKGVRECGCPDVALSAREVSRSAQLS